MAHNAHRLAPNADNAQVYPPKTCVNCPVGGRCVGGWGDISAELVIIAEAPGQQELATGIPLTGPSGELLWGTMRRSGLPADTPVYVTNSLQCRPPTGTPPPRMAIASCRDRVADEIAAAPRKVIIAFGNSAVHSLTRDHSLKITQIRGSAFDYNGAIVVPTVHPASVLRSPNTFKQMASDINYAVRLFLDPSVRKDPGETKHFIATEETVSRLIAMLRRKEVLSLDIETTGFNARTDRVLCVGLSWAKNQALIIPEKLVRRFKPLLEDPNVTFVTHNGKFDTAFLRTMGIEARVDEDTMLMHYCLAPQTRVMKSDLTWPKIEDIKVGDELVGFDEFDMCTMKPSKVTAIKRLVAPCYKITTERGSVVCSAHHSWVTRRYHQRVRKWTTTETLANSSGHASLQYFVGPWDPDETRDGGWLAGILDGEGHVSSTWTNKTGDQSNWTIGFAQKEGLVLDKALALLEERGVEYRSYFYDGTQDGYGKGYKSPVARVVLKGDRASLRALGVFRPERLMKHAVQMWQGRRKHSPTDIKSIEYVGEQEVIGIETETRTLVAEGFLSHNCLDEIKGGHGLKDLSSDLLGAPDYDSEMKKKYLKRKTDTFEAIPKRELWGYLAKDADYTWQIYWHLKAQLERQGNEGLVNLYRRVLLPASDLLRDVERNGIYIDRQTHSRIKRKLEIAYNEALSEVQAVAEDFWDAQRFADETGAKNVPGFFNPGSPAQLGWLLFRSMGFRPPRGAKRGKTGSVSTDEDTLKKLGKHPVLDAILRMREHGKALSTYAQGIEDRLEPDGRVHATFLIHGTVTGRLSSQNPNLQNITRPGKGETLPLRAMFGAPRGRLLLEADYKSAELRGLAHLSGDQALTAVFESRRDLHDEVAKRMFPPGFDPVVGRIRAKALNFGIVYGRTAYTIAQEFGIPVPEAQQMIDDWFAAFPDAHRFIEECRLAPTQGKYVQNPFGRRRRFGLVTPDNVDALQNEAANSPIQGMASDLTLLSAVEMNVPLRQYDAFIVNLVHDSVLVELPATKEAVLAVGRLVRRTMIDVPIKYLNATVPFDVDIKIGRNWGLAREVEIPLDDEVAVAAD